MTTRHRRSSSNRAWYILWLLPSMLLVIGCQCVSEFLIPTVPSYTGTFTGRAVKDELHSRDGSAFGVTSFKIEAARGKIKSAGNPVRPWKDEWRPTVVLVDACSTTYPPDSYAGKNLNVTGTIIGASPHPFPGGPVLFAPPPLKPATGLTPINVLLVKHIMIVGSGDSGHVAASPSLARRATSQDFTGTWIGHTVSSELHSEDGKAFPVTEFKIERSLSIDKPRNKHLPVTWPTVILVDRCYTAYPPDSYAGKNRNVAGTIEDGTVFPFPGGPQLFLSNQAGSVARQHRSRVLVVDWIGFGR